MGDWCSIQVGNGGGADQGAGRAPTQSQSFRNPAGGHRKGEREALARTEPCRRRGCRKHDAGGLGGDTGT